MLAVSYGNVYVAQIAMGANPNQTLKAFHEAESYPWPVVDPGLQPVHRPRHQHDARHDASKGRGAIRLLAVVPLRSAAGARRRASVPSRQPQADDAVRANSPCRKLASRWGSRSNPEHAERLIALAQKDIDDQWHYYEQMAGVEREIIREHGELPTCVPT